MANNKKLDISGPFIPRKKTQKIPRWKLCPAHVGVAVFTPDGKITQRLIP